MPFACFVFGTAFLDDIVARVAARPRHPRELPARQPFAPVAGGPDGRTSYRRARCCRCQAGQMSARAAERARCPHELPSGPDVRASCRAGPLSRICRFGRGLPPTLQRPRSSTRKPGSERPLLLLVSKRAGAVERWIACPSICARAVPSSTAALVHRVCPHTQTLAIPAPSQTRATNRGPAEHPSRPRCPRKARSGPPPRARNRASSSGRACRASAR